MKKKYTIEFEMDQLEDQWLSDDRYLEGIVENIKRLPKTKNIMWEQEG